MKTSKANPKRLVGDVLTYLPIILAASISQADAVGGGAVSAILGFMTPLGIGIASVGLGSVGWHYVFAHDNHDLVKRGVAACIGGALIAAPGTIASLIS